MNNYEMQVELLRREAEVQRSTYSNFSAEKVMLDAADIIEELLKRIPAPAKKRAPRKAKKES